MASQFQFTLTMSILLTIGGLTNCAPNDLFENTPEKWNGVSLVGSDLPPSNSPATEIKQASGANWVALMPYSFTSLQDPEVKFDANWQWWGERSEGIVQCAEWCASEGLKIMIKPHVWVKEQGWNGDFTLDSESDWIIWEDSYEAYILHYANLAQQLKADAFCIGVELRQVVQQRPSFFESLIEKVRAVYEGPLTYAANWDNYNNVKFWSQLDYIGIDAYFPISTKASPTLEELSAGWKAIKLQLHRLAKEHQLPILFTEYGYRSMDQAAGEHWKLPDDWKYEGISNETLQSNAYQAVFDHFWNQPWFMGGFLWKWYVNHDQAGGPNNTDFTPQNKAAQQTILNWYIRHP